MHSDFASTTSVYVRLIESLQRASRKLIVSQNVYRFTSHRFMEVFLFVYFAQFTTADGDNKVNLIKQRAFWR